MAVVDPYDVESSRDEWREELGAGEYQPWGDEMLGKPFRAHFQAIRPGQKGKLVSLVTREGTRSFSCTAVLDRKLQTVAVGDLIEITYVGWKQSAKGGLRYRDFDVARIKRPAVVPPPEPDAQDDGAAF
jgi:hypothetical protein